MPVWFQSAPAPAPGLAGAGAGAGIRSLLWPDHGQITTSVVLLGVQVTDMRRGYLGGRRRRRQQVPGPAPASPGAGAGAGIRSLLWPDHGQITTSVVLLGVQVTDLRRGYLGGRRRRD